MLLLAILLGSANGIGMMGARSYDPEADKAIAKIGDELANIRTALVQTQLESTKAIATAMQELSDHSRRLESLESLQTSRQRSGR